MTSQPAAPAERTEHRDGRRAWRDRNRLAVVDALLDFYAEGNLRPGAQAVAERSGVSRRSVFRYFEDLDDLDRTAIARQHERVAHLVEIPSLGQGTLESRIERIAACRVALYEAIAPVARVTRTRAPFHHLLAEQLARGRRALTRQVERHFQPELDALGATDRAEVLAAADGICSFEFYDLLQSTRQLGQDATATVMARALHGLFAPAPAAPVQRGMRPW